MREGGREGGAGGRSGWAGGTLPHNLFCSYQNVTYSHIISLFLLLLTVLGTFPMGQGSGWRRAWSSPISPGSWKERIKELGWAWPSCGTYVHLVEGGREGRREGGRDGRRERIKELGWAWPSCGTYVHVVEGGREGGREGKWRKYRDSKFRNQNARVCSCAFVFTPHPFTHLSLFPLSSPFRFLLLPLQACAAMPRVGARRQWRQPRPRG